MRTKLVLGFVAGLAFLSLLQLAPQAQAKDATETTHATDGTVKHVGTADDADSSVRDPQSNQTTSPAQADDSNEVYHFHPATGPNGKESWTR